MVKVSVIIPIYNMQSFLATCLDSVLNQSFRDLEVILVDDGSTDETPAICCRYRELDTRIRVIRKENGGLSSARNAGLEAATGKYIYFVDSDDYLEPTLLEKAVAVMEQEDCHWVGFGAIKEDVQGNLLGTVGFKPYHLSVKSEQERADFLMQYLLSYRLGWEACFHLFRGDIIRKHRLRFISEREVFAEDLLFSFTYWQYADSCVMLPDCLYHYVQRPDSLMGASRSQSILPRIPTLALEARKAASQASNSHIVNHFPSIYIHLLEWQTRPFVAQMGTAWLKAAMDSLDHSQLLDCTRWGQVYREYLCRFGRISGVVTAVISLLSRDDIPKAERCICQLLEQSLQKLDILVLCADGLQVTAEDFRVRQVQIADSHPEALLRTACREALGEYIYFAHPDTPLPVDFLARMGDVLKYNDCGTVLPAAGDTRFLDKHNLSHRAFFREHLRTLMPRPSDGLFRRDLLENSGLSLLPALEEYTADVLLSGHILLTD